MQAHLARAQSKYQRSAKSLKRNLASSQLPSPEAPDLPIDLSLPTFATDDDDFLSPISEVGPESIDDEPSLLKRAQGITNSRVFSGNAGVRGGKKLKGDDKASAPAAKSTGNVAKRAAIDLEPRGAKVVSNPKYIANPKVSAAAKVGGSALTEYGNGMRESTLLSQRGRKADLFLNHFAVWAGRITIGTPPVPYIIDFDTGYVRFPKTCRTC